MRYFKFLRGGNHKGSNDFVSCALPSHLWDVVKFILKDLYEDKQRPTRLYVFNNDYVELMRTWVNPDNGKVHSHIQVRHNQDVFNFYYKEGLYIHYVMYMYEIN